MVFAAACACRRHRENSQGKKKKKKKRSCHAVFSHRSLPPFTICLAICLYNWHFCVSHLSCLLLFLFLPCLILSHVSSCLWEDTSTQDKTWRGKTSHKARQPHDTRKITQDNWNTRQSQWEIGRQAIATGNQDAAKRPLRQRILDSVKHQKWRAAVRQTNKRWCEFKKDKMMWVEGKARRNTAHRPKQDRQKRRQRGVTRKNPSLVCVDLSQTRQEN